MDKAYDLKDLAKKLELKGLPVVEETARQVYEAVHEWIAESAVLSENKIDDVAVPLAFPMLDKVVLPAIDKIDGEVKA